MRAHWITRKATATMRALPISLTTIRLLKVVCLAALPAAFADASFAQITVTGRVLDGEGAPVAYANVQLLADADSSFVKGSVADEQGHFAVEDVKTGSYLLFVSLIGYQAYVSEAQAVSREGENDVGTIALRQTTIELEEVAVEARRSLYEQKTDRLVINVGTSLALAGATALDVLERSPGIIVDKLSASISMLGKSGVRLMINGKRSYIPADGLVQFLMGMSADNIESIELITSPSADFDAEGNAGYINLVLKRNPDDGLSGTRAASGGYGRGELGNATTNLNYRRDRVDVFGSYSLLLNGSKQIWQNYRRIVGPDGVTESPSEIRRDPIRRVHNARAWIDYRITERTTIGGLISAFDNRWSMNANSSLTMRTNGTPVRLVYSDNNEINYWRHVMGNVNVRHELNSGDKFSLDLDHLRYHNDNPTDYFNTTTNVTSGEVHDEQLASGKKTPLHITVAKADYNRTASEKVEFGLGAKGSFSRFTNEATFDGLIRSEWVADIGLRSKGELREDILALYGTANVQVSESASLKVGLRYELTDSNLGSDEEADIVDRRFGSLFPSVAYSHELSDRHRLGGSYTRRITRPSFGHLAPWLYFMDPYTIMTGNVTLQPAIINAVKLDVTAKPVFGSIEYAWEDSTIVGGHNHVMADENIQVVFPINFRSTQRANVMIAAPVDITKWWSMQNNVTGIWRRMQGYRNDQLLTNSRTSFRVNSTQNVRLPRGWSLEANAFYQTGGLFGDVRYASWWTVHLALQWSLFDKGKLTLSIYDILNSGNFVAESGSPDDSLYIKRTTESGYRTFRLAYSMRFGEGKAARNRSTASQEESRRAE